jgi:hypothetical protein
MFVRSLSWYNDHLVQNGAKDRMRFLLCLTCGVHVATGVSNDNRKRVCRQLCVDRRPFFLNVSCLSRDCLGKLIVFFM